jgi:hypothetical protein
MNQPLRDRIARRLESLSDERLYQVLDYVEFLESKYATRQAPPQNVFTRFAETVEDRLRAGRVSASTIAETMSLMNRAMGVLNGVAAAGKSVANDIVGAATRPSTSGTGETPSAATTPAAATAAPAPQPLSSAGPPPSPAAPPSATPPGTSGESTP